ncbi:hypothetical protein PENTCL1PPCAC_21823, partial [Pristionchus entomophagus]
LALFLQLPFRCPSMECLVCDRRAGHMRFKHSWIRPEKGDCLLFSDGSHGQVEEVLIARFVFGCTEDSSRQIDVK